MLNNLVRPLAKLLPGMVHMTLHQRYLRLAQRMEPSLKLHVLAHRHGVRVVAQHQPLAIEHLVERIDVRSHRQAADLDRKMGLALPACGTWGEDIDKLTLLARAGKTMTDEITKIEKVIRGIYRDLESAGLLTDTVKKKYNENRKASDELIKQIEEKSFSNRKCLASLRGNYRNRIDNIMKSVSPELRILHSASFPDQSDMLDIEV